ncbi:MAG: FAD-binding protein, partial [Oscillospiraceae bacterium]|nr:FAD-binding protein [Oscillospiraceae bacterium]
RFPTILAECLTRGIDITKDPIPVRPVHHYQVGGVGVNLNARTTVPDLYAVGEVSCTGVHGANRLASNSMLECLVFGRRAAMSVNNEQLTVNNYGTGGTEPEGNPVFESALSIVPFQRQIRRICDECAGVIRTVKRMERGLSEIGALLEEIPIIRTREWVETRNMALSASAVLSAAIKRKESAGTHYVESEDEAHV